MEYAIDQPVIFDEHLGYGELTGKITGHSGEDFIITLDQRLHDGTRTVLVPAAIVRPLACHWCRDTQKVAASPVTGEQIASGGIPQVDCQYCTK